MDILNDDDVLMILYEDCISGNKRQKKHVNESDLNTNHEQEEDSLLDSCELENDCLDVDEKKIKTYWTDETELAIVEFLYLNEFFYKSRIAEEVDEAERQNRVVNNFYCNEMQRKMEEIMQITDREIRRDKIFREKIHSPLKKLVENILFNYKLFLSDTDAKTQQRDCVTFLYTKFPNFNPWRKTKSFSFFGTIAKHYFLGNRKEYSKNTKIIHDYDSNKEEVDSTVFENPNSQKCQDVSYDLFNFIVKSIESELNKSSLSKNDKKVADAIVQIFKNHEILGVYNKTHIYQLIKERTGLEAKEVTYSLQRFRNMYKFLKQDFAKKNT